MHPDARCLVIRNVFEHIKKRLGLDSDLLPEETDAIPVMDIPEVHEILTCLCRSVEEDGRMYL